MFTSNTSVARVLLICLCVHDAAKFFVYALTGYYIQLFFSCSNFSTTSIGTTDMLIEKNHELPYPSRFWFVRMSIDIGMASLMSI